MASAIHYLLQLSAISESSEPASVERAVRVIAAWVALHPSIRADWHSNIASYVLYIISPAQAAPETLVVPAKCRVRVGNTGLKVYSSLFGIRTPVIHRAA
jgi:hypothetical protein